MRFLSLRATSVLLDGTCRHIIIIRCSGRVRTTRSARNGSNQPRRQQTNKPAPTEHIDRWQLDVGLPSQPSIPHHPNREKAQRLERTDDGGHVVRLAHDSNSAAVGEQIVGLVHHVPGESDHDGCVGAVILTNDPARQSCVHDRQSTDARSATNNTSRRKLE